MHFIGGYWVRVIPIIHYPGIAMHVLSGLSIQRFSLFRFGLLSLLANYFSQQRLSSPLLPSPSFPSSSLSLSLIHTHTHTHRCTRTHMRGNTLFHCQIQDPLIPFSSSRPGKFRDKSSSLWFLIITQPLCSAKQSKANLLEVEPRSVF